MGCDLSCRIAGFAVHWCRDSMESYNLHSGHRRTVESHQRAVGPPLPGRSQNVSTGLRTKTGTTSPIRSQTDTRHLCPRQVAAYTGTANDRAVSGGNVPKSPARADDSSARALSARTAGLNGMGAGAITGSEPDPTPTWAWAFYTPV